MKYIYLCWWFQIVTPDGYEKLGFLQQYALPKFKGSRRPKERFRASLGAGIPQLTGPSGLIVYSHAEENEWVRLTSSALL